MAARPQTTSPAVFDFRETGLCLLEPGPEKGVGHTHFLPLFRVNAPPFFPAPSNVVDAAFDPGDVGGKLDAQFSLDFRFQKVNGVVVVEIRRVSKSDGSARNPPGGPRWSRDAWRRHDSSSWADPKRAGVSLLREIGCSTRVA